MRLHPLEEIDIQWKNRFERKRSVDTTSDGSDVTVIEGAASEDAAESDTFAMSEDVCSKVCDELASKPGALPSCLLRRDSSRASIKKKVRCSETTEVIPPPDYFINEDWNEVHQEDDDDVFSDTAPVQTPKGNMCTPYVERKGSLPTIEALPGWFPDSRLLSRSVNFHSTRVDSIYTFLKFSPSILTLLVGISLLLLLPATALMVSQGLVE